MGCVIVFIKESDVGKNWNVFTEESDVDKNISNEYRSERVAKIAYVCNSSYFLEI